MRGKVSMRFINNSRNHVVFIFLISAFATSCERFERWVTEPQVIRLNEVARERLSNEKALPPQQELMEALAIDPSRYELHTNLGIMFNRIKKNEESEKSLTEALRLAELANDKKSIFMTSFNLGVLYSGQRKIPEALQYYQKALDLAPTSIEVRHNIELLWQQQNQSENGDSQNQDQKQGNKDQQKEGEGDQNQEPKEDSGQDRQQTPKYKPRPFNSNELSDSDAKKMLEELSRQDKRIRNQYNNRKNQNSKDEANEKDW